MQPDEATVKTAIRGGAAVVWDDEEPMRPARSCVKGCRLVHGNGPLSRSGFPTIRGTRYGARLLEATQARQRRTLGHGLRRRPRGLGPAPPRALAELATPRQATLPTSCPAAVAEA